MARLVLVLAALLFAAGARAETVEFPSLDARAPIRAELFPPEAAGPRPAAVLLHGCGGMWNRSGRLLPVLREAAKHLTAMGYLVLVPDSFRPRRVEEVCSQPLRERPVTQAQRRGDALGALAWLRARPEVDPARIVAIGWSHGGSVVLNATNRLSEPVANAGFAFRAAIAFYPGCNDGRGAMDYAPIAPVLVLMGEADDWTSPVPCRRIAEKTAAAHEPFELVLYPGAYHGFDMPGTLSLTRQVQGGRRTVTLATDPAARADAARRLDAFLAAQIGN